MSETQMEMTLYRVTRQVTSVQYLHIVADSPEAAKKEADENGHHYTWNTSSDNDSEIVEVVEAYPDERSKIWSKPDAPLRD